MCTIGYQVVSDQSECVNIRLHWVSAPNLLRCSEPWRKRNKTISNNTPGKLRNIFRHPNLLKMPLKIKQGERCIFFWGNLKILNFPWNPCICDMPPIRFLWNIWFLFFSSKNLAKTIFLSIWKNYLKFAWKITSKTKYIRRVLGQIRNDLVKKWASNFLCHWQISGKNTLILNKWSSFHVWKLVKVAYIIVSNNQNMYSIFFMFIFLLIFTQNSCIFPQFHAYSQQNTQKSS